MRSAIARPWRWCVAVTVAGVVMTTLAYPQDAPQKNPREKDRQAILDGMALYRTRCAGCHGVDGTGVTGPNLAMVVGGGASDGRLFQTIRRGIPNTEMPSSTQPEDEIWRIVAYLRTLGAVGGDASRPQPARGNAANGERIFSGALGC